MIVRLIRNYGTVPMTPEQVILLLAIAIALTGIGFAIYLLAKYLRRRGSDDA